MNWEEAILHVLREAGEPMAYKDIGARIVAEGLADPGVANVDVLTHAAITGLKVDGLVESTPRGMYALPE